MKKLFTTKSFLAIMVFAMLAIFATPQIANAQTAFGEKSADLTHFYAKFPTTLIDSTATVYSEWFTLRGYDYESMVTYPINFYYKLSSTAGKPRVLGTIQGASDILDSDTYVVVDSATANADSTETFTYKSLDLNGKKYPWYRLKLTGTAGNRSDTYIKAEIWYSRNKKQ